jgi:hypothetical protein
MLMWKKEKDEKRLCLLLAKRSSLSIISLTTNLGCLVTKDKTKKEPIVHHVLLSSGGGSAPESFRHPMKQCLGPAAK